MNNKPIGVFDSGLGGVNVLETLEQLMPNEKFIYLADTKNAPYGDKTREELEIIVENDIKTLVDFQVKLIVIACNTASTIDIKSLSKKYNIEIISVVDGGVAEVNEEDKNILLTATKATVDSKIYEKSILQKYPSINIESVACPEIVPNIEFLNPSPKDIQNIVDGYVKPYENKGLTSLILGCTHYPLWQEYFEKALPGVRMINPAFETGNLVKNHLQKHNILCERRNCTEDTVLYYCTGDLELFSKKYKEIFKKSFLKVEKI